jgi:hypothetical protein
MKPFKPFLILPYLLAAATSFWLQSSVAIGEDSAPGESDNVANSGDAGTVQRTEDGAANSTVNAPSPGGRGLAMVYDPESKKYFIGASARFTIKQVDQNTLVDRIEVSIDGGAWQEYTGAIQFTEEGKHNVKFRAINPVNSWSPVQFVDVFVDLEAPLTQMRFEDATMPFTKIGRGTAGIADSVENFVRMNSQITLVGHDNLSGVGRIEYSWDSESAFQRYETPLVIDKPGKRTLFYRTIDRVGNVEKSQRIDVFADGSAPTTEMKVTGGTLTQSVIGGTSYSAARDSVAFTLEAVDTGAGVREILVSVDGQPAKAYIKPIYFLQEGPHKINYQAVDNVGNLEALKTLNIYTVSNAPRTVATPSGTIVNTGGINFARTDTKLKLEAGDSPVGLEKIEYRLEEETVFKPYTEAIRFEKSGNFDIVFRSVDRVGNREPTRNFRLVVSQVPPKTKIDTAQPLVQRDGITYSPSPNVVTLNVDNHGVGVEQTMVSVNDSPFMAYSGPINLTNDKKVYKITFKSVDKLGNEEPAQTVTYHIIGSAPVVDLFVSDHGRQAEQVRTDYFEDPSIQKAVRSAPAVAPAEMRGVASEKKTKPASRPATTGGKLPQ